MFRCVVLRLEMHQLISLVLPFGTLLGGASNRAQGNHLLEIRPFAKRFSLPVKVSGPYTFAMISKASSGAHSHFISQRNMKLRRYEEYSHINLRFLGFPSQLVQHAPSTPFTSPPTLDSSQLQNPQLKKSS
jgi:hypothetical protein